jgi:septum formation protein
MKIVLASESPIRKRALDLLKLSYETCPSRIDEKAIRDNDPARLTQKLAEAKARKVAEQHPDAIIVAGDAVVSKGGKIYEKPRDKAEALRFLRELSDGELQFVTSLAVLNAASGKMLSTVEISNITFRSLNDDEITAYMRQYNVLHYAGAFESDAVLFFSERFSGSYNVVAALPVNKLILFLREHGVEI